MYKELIVSIIAAVALVSKLVFGIVIEDVIAAEIADVLSNLMLSVVTLAGIYTAWKARKHEKSPE